MIISIKGNLFCVKDYDERGKRLGEQPIRRMVPACNLNTFSLGNSKPIFPGHPGVTLSICQGKHYATFYDNCLGIARYSLYKISAKQATEKKVQRPNGDPWQPNLTPGKVISVTIRI